MPRRQPIRTPPLGWASGSGRGRLRVKVLVLGASGQLGSAIVTAAGTHLDVVSVDRDVDLCDADSIEATVLGARPDWVVNCAAMTDVDGAHLDPARAFAVNALGAASIARSAQAVGARIVQISTEAVFDGEFSKKYVESDACDPVSVYGTSKLAGESLVRIYAPDSYVLRTSWLYSGGVGMNFPTRILEQLADPERQLSVVTDVVGNPTPTAVLAHAILAVIASPPAAGTYHVCCTGSASKFEWAVEIAESAGFDPGRIAAVTSDLYPTVALRPKHVDLDCKKFQATGLYALPTWQDAWRQVSG